MICTQKYNQSFHYSIHYFVGLIFISTGFLACDNSDPSSNSSIEALQNPCRDGYDLVGDICLINIEADEDRDGVPDGVDNCVYDANPDQSDCDYDDEGDACDEDQRCGAAMTGDLMSFEVGASNAIPFPYAKIEILGLPEPIISDEFAQYKINLLPVGKHQILFYDNFLMNDTQTVDVQSSNKGILNRAPLASYTFEVTDSQVGTTIIKDWLIKPTGSIGGRIVVDPNRLFEEIHGGTGVYIEELPNLTAVTNDFGFFIINGIPEGTYTLRHLKRDYQTNTYDIEVVGLSTSDLNNQMGVVVLNPNNEATPPQWNQSIQVQVQSNVLANSSVMQSLEVILEPLFPHQTEPKVFIFNQVEQNEDMITFRLNPDQYRNVQSFADNNSLIHQAHDVYHVSVSGETIKGSRQTNVFKPEGLQITILKALEFSSNPYAIIDHDGDGVADKDEEDIDGDGCIENDVSIYNSFVCRLETDIIPVSSPPQITVVNEEVNVLAGVMASINLTISSVLTETIFLSVESADQSIIANEGLSIDFDGESHLLNINATQSGTTRLTVWGTSPQGQSSYIFINVNVYPSSFEILPNTPKQGVSGKLFTFDILFNETDMFIDTTKLEVSIQQDELDDSYMSYFDYFEYTSKKDRFTVEFIPKSGPNIPDSFRLYFTGIVKDPKSQNEVTRSNILPISFQIYDLNQTGGVQEWDSGNDQQTRGIVSNQTGDTWVLGRHRENNVTINWLKHFDQDLLPTPQYPLEISNGIEYLSFTTKKINLLGNRLFIYCEMTTATGNHYYIGTLEVSDLLNRVNAPLVMSFFSISDPFEGEFKAHEFDVSDTGEVAVSFLHTINNTSDFIVHKMNASGAIIMEKTIHTTSSDDEWSRSVLHIAEEYVYGAFTVSRSDGDDIYQGGLTDVKIFKLDEIGNEQTVSYIGSEDLDLINSITSDDAGHIYVCGSAGATPGVGLDESFMEVGLQEVFIAKYKIEGMEIEDECIWKTQFGSTQNDMCYKIQLHNTALYAVGSWNEGTMRPSDSFRASLDLETGDVNFRKLDAVFIPDSDTYSKDVAYGLTYNGVHFVILGESTQSLNSNQGIGTYSWVRRMDLDGNTILR
jgi:hypothetical protein